MKNFKLGLYIILSQIKRIKMDFDNEVDYYKIVTVGDICCGKTSISNRWIHETFDIEWQSTVGTDFKKKLFEVDEKPLAF